MKKSLSTRASPSDRRTRELTLLLQVTGAANRSADVGEITERTLAAISQAVPHDLAFFLLVNPLAGRLELASPRNVPVEMELRLERLALPEDFYHQAQHPEYGAYSLSDLVAQVRQVLCDNGFPNPITVPLIAEHRAMGILALGLSGGELRDEFLGHTDLLDSVGTSVGLALMRAQLSEQLRASEQRYHDYIENSPDGFWEYAPGQTVTLVNRAALEIIGYTREEVEGKTFAGITLESEQSIRALGEAIRRDGAVNDWRFRIRTKQGVVKTLNLSGRIVREEGKPERFQLIFRDASKRVKIEQALERRVEELRSLAQVGHLLSRNPGSQDTLTEVALEMQRVFAVESAVIIVEAGTGIRAASSSVALGRRGAELYNHLQPLMENNGPVCVDNRDRPEVDAEEQDWMRRIGAVAYLASPLVSGSRSLGILLLCESEAKHWSEEETRLAGTFASQIAGDLQQALLLEEVQARLHELQVFADTSDLASSMVDERVAVDLTLEAIRDLLGADAAGVHLLDGDRFRVGRLRGAPAPTTPLELTPLVRQILDSNDPYVFDSEHPAVLDVQANERMSDIGARSIMVMRLSASTGPLGLVTVASRSGRVWKPGEQLALKTIASQLAIAIVNARVYHEQLDRARRLKLLVSLAETCAATARLDTLLHAAADKVKLMLGANYVSIRLLRGEALSSQVAAGMREDDPLGGPIPVYPVLRRILDSQELYPIVDLNYTNDLPPEYSGFLAANGIKSALLVPVVVKGKTEGLLAVCFATPHSWTEQEMHFAQAIGHTVAFSLDRARLFESLDQEKRDTAMILDSVFSGVFTTDRAGVIQTWNRAAAVMTGLSLEQVRGRNWRDIVRIEENEPDDLIFEAMEDNRVVFAVRNRMIVKAGGGAFPAAEAAAPLYDAEQNIRGAVGAFWDRTKETQAERMKREFLAEMSHELRNSLTVVMSMAGLLRDPKVRGVTRERAIQVAGRQVDRLQNFADRFLEFESKHFKDQLELTPIELSGLLGEAAMSVTAGHPHVRIELPVGEWRVLGEQERLRTVLLNLVENAAKYSDPERPVEVGIAHVEGNRIQVTVHNWGPVIPAEAQEHIFERGFRVHLTGPDGRPVNGSGIGLWLAKTQLLECGSDIQVSSSEAEGTSFRFTLSEAQSNEQKQSADPDRGRRRRRGRRAPRPS